MRLDEIMSTGVKTIDAAESAQAAWDRMAIEEIKHLVVMENRAVVGVVSERDLGGRAGTGVRKNKRVSEVMTPQVVTAKSDTTIRQAANLLRGRGIGCLPIMVGDKVAGIVTATDLLELLGRGQERPGPRAERAVLSRRQEKFRKVPASAMKASAR